MTLFKSDRSFKLWDYSASHQQLLIRSASTPDIATNIDVVFVGVEFLSLPITFKGLAISQGNTVENIGLDFSPSRHGELFVIESDGKKYALAALACRVLENTLDIFESSLEGFGATDPNRDIGKVLACS